MGMILLHRRAAANNGPGHGRTAFGVKILLVRRGACGSDRIQVGMRRGRLAVRLL